MENEKHHITSFFSNGKVLIALLTLTAITVMVTSFHFGAFSVGIALIIASIKAFIVLTYFMHLKHESRTIKLLVSGVFVLFALVVIITFFDYLFRTDMIRG
jgi:cytochrome c oxidase subunit IV